MFDPEDGEGGRHLLRANFGEFGYQRIGIFVIVNLAFGTVGGGYDHDLFAGLGVAGESAARRDDFIIGMGVESKETGHCPDVTSAVSPDDAAFGGVVSRYFDVDPIARENPDLAAPGHPPRGAGHYLQPPRQFNKKRGVAQDGEDLPLHPHILFSVAQRE